jgi:hypothetical protein
MINKLNIDSEQNMRETEHILRNLCESCLTAIKKSGKEDLYVDLVQFNKFCKNIKPEVNDLSHKCTSQELDLQVSVSQQQSVAS